MQPLLNLSVVASAGTALHLFAGGAIPTVETLNSNLKQRTLTTRTESLGDRTATRKSTLADQRRAGDWAPNVQSPAHYRDDRFLFDDHLGSTRDTKFADNALYLLLEEPAKSSLSRAARCAWRSGPMSSFKIELLKLALPLDCFTNQTFGCCHRLTLTLLLALVVCGRICLDSLGLGGKQIFKVFVAVSFKRVGWNKL